LLGVAVLLATDLMIKVFYDHEAGIVQANVDRGLFVESHW
jgi:hypothetical protein